MNDAITPFRVGIAEAATEDLRERLHRTRWPEPATVCGWSQGPADWVRKLCRYWLEDYDFAGAQERLNRFPQFRQRSTASPSASSTPPPRIPARSR